MQFDICPGNGQTLFQRADCDVDSRDLGRQTHQGVVVIGNRCSQVGVRGLDAAPEAPPEVQFPGGIKAGLVIHEAVLGLRVVIRAVLAELHGRY